MQVKSIKKGHRRDPTFVNLKSNTMKNTLQRYGFLQNLQVFFSLFGVDLIIN
jgi:hypothetical protein